MNDSNLDNIAHPLARYRNHLEFNGYYVEEDNESLLCIHSRRPNLTVLYFSEKLVMIGIIERRLTFKPEITRIERLEYVNALNLEFKVVKAFLCEDNLMIDTSFKGGYDRKNFCDLLEDIELDLETLEENELTEEYLQ